MLAQPYPGGCRLRQHPRERQAREIELQGQAARPYPDRDALPAARSGDHPRRYPARNPLRGRRPADRQQARRAGGASRARKLQRYARKRTHVPPAQPAPVPGGRHARRAGAPHRQEHVGVTRGGQERTGARTAGQAILRPYDPAPLCGTRVGQFRPGRGDDHGQHRPQPPRPAEDVRIRRRVGRQARRDPLAGAETLRLCDAGRMPARNGPHAPDTRPHVVAGTSALQRRTLWRRPHPEGHDLLEIQAIRRKLLRRAAPPCTARAVTRVRTPDDPRNGIFRERTARRFPCAARQMGNLRSGIERDG